MIKKIYKIMIVMLIIFFAGFFINSCNEMKKGKNVTIADLQNSIYLSKNNNYYFLFSLEDGTFYYYKNDEKLIITFCFTLEKGIISLKGIEEDSSWSLKITCFDNKVLYISRYNVFIYKIDI